MAAALITACSSDKVLPKGERISVLQPVAAIKPDIPNGMAKISVPAAFVNKSWSQESYNAQHLQQNFKISPSFKKQWSSSFGKGGAKREFLISKPLVYGNKVYTSNCQKVNGGVKPKDLTINGTRKGTISVYSDSSCKNKLVSRDTKAYTCSNCAPLTISIGKLNVTNMSKGTVVHNGIVFNVLDSSKSYYHQWRTYTNGKLTFTGSCIKITGGKQYVKDLTINGTRKGTITVYSDNKCSKRITTVPMAETQTFTCKDCNVSNNSNSNYQPSYNNSSSGNKSNKSNKSNKRGCKLYNYSYTCPSGWTKVGDGPTAYCQQQTGYSYTCPSGYTKVGDGPTAYCQSKTKTAGKCKYNRNILKNGGFSCSVNSGKFRDLPSCQKKCYVRNTQSIKKKKNYATKKITATKNCIG